MTNLKKKLFGAILTIIIVLSMSLATFAEPIDDDGNKPRRISPPVETVIIPELPQE